MHTLLENYNCGPYFSRGKVFWLPDKYKEVTKGSANDPHREVFLLNGVVCELPEDLVYMSFGTRTKLHTVTTSSTLQSMAGSAVKGKDVRVEECADRSGAKGEGELPQVD